MISGIRCSRNVVEFCVFVLPMEKDDGWLVSIKDLSLFASICNHPEGYVCW